MRKVAPAALALAVLAVVQAAGGDPKSDKPAEKAAGALLDQPQEVTLLLFNGGKRPVYLLKLTPEELTYKQSAKGTEVVKYSAKDGAVVEVLTPRGGKFVLNKGTNAFEAAVPEPPADQKAEGEKPKPLELTKLEQAILDLTNEERKKADLPPLKVNEKLVLLARAHSENMAKQNRLDHVLDGKDPAQRARDAGYGPFVAENCAWGARSAPEVVRGWMESAGHKANILNKHATEVGIGHAFSPKTGPYYTQVFGLRRPN